MQKNESQTSIASYGDGQSTGTTRPAVVVTRHLRKEYVGTVRVSDGFVHLHGARRKVGHGDDATYRHAADHTWPRREIVRVRWLEGLAP